MNKWQSWLIALVGIALVIGGTYWMWCTDNWDDMAYQYTGKAIVSSSEALLAVANFDAKIITIGENVAISVNTISSTRLENIPTWVNEQELYSPSVGKLVLTAFMVAVGLFLFLIGIATK
jgi:hypothetical protein